MDELILENPPLNKLASGMVAELDEKKRYYVQQYLTEKDSEDVFFSNHMLDAKMKSIRASVKAHMPNVYTNIDFIRSQTAQNMRKSQLHCGRGRTLREQSGAPVLRLDLAGSGFTEFRALHKNLVGKNQVVIGDTRYKLDKSIDSQLRKETRELKLRCTAFGRWLAGIRTPEELAERNKTIRQSNDELRAENAHIREEFAKMKAFSENEYGKSVGYGKKEYKHIRKSVSKSGDRISMAGPLGLKGTLNLGAYSIENLREHVLVASANYLTDIFSKWNGDKNCKDVKDVHIMLNGHSRGGVASVEGAMRVKAWVHEAFPMFADRVKFDLVQYDPVPGTDARRGLNKEVDLQGDAVTVESGKAMRALGDSAETTVVYSMHSNEDINHRNFFNPQAVMGAKRVILTPMNHSVGLDQVDKCTTNLSGKPAGENHRLGYTDAKTGAVYMGSAINELPAGVYIADERNTLIRFDNYEQVKEVMKDVLGDTYKQKTRHETVLSMAECWFKRYDPAHLVGPQKAANNLADNQPKNAPKQEVKEPAKAGPKPGPKM